MESPYNYNIQYWNIMKLDLLQYSNLPIGQTASGDCPKCGQNKFYVTRKPTGYAFICFRASCGYRGFSGEGSPPPAVNIDMAVRNPHSREWTGDLGLPNSEDIDYFQQRFDIDLSEDNGYSLKVTRDQRYAFPVWGPRDEYRGIIIRRPCWSGLPRPPRMDFKGDDYPKSLSYFERNARAHCGWAHSTIEDTVVIVEDPVSALRVSYEGFTAICIYGTHWKLEFCHDLNTFKAKRHILALDPDATHKALKIASQWQTAIPNLSVAVLRSDPKDYDSSTKLLEDLRL